jgi:hypothetical protein
LHNNWQLRGAPCEIKEVFVQQSIFANFVGFCYCPRMRTAIAIAAAITCFLISAALLCTVNLITNYAVAEWGIAETIAEYTGTAWNFSLFIGCWLVGLASLWAGLSAVYRRLVWPIRRTAAIQQPVG